MTIPYLTNCSHSGEGWCLNCIKLEHDQLNHQISELTLRLNEANDLNKRLVKSLMIVSTVDRCNEITT